MEILTRVAKELGMNLFLVKKTKMETDLSFLNGEGFISGETSQPESTVLQRPLERQYLLVVLISQRILPSFIRV